jgi:hypothetical protein
MKIQKAARALDRKRQLRAQIHGSSAINGFQADKGIHI